MKRVLAERTSPDRSFIALNLLVYRTVLICIASDVDNISCGNKGLFDTDTKSVKLYKTRFYNCLQFSHNDAPKVWNELPNDIYSATSLLSFWKKLKADHFTKAHPP